MTTPALAYYIRPRLIDDFESAFRPVAEAGIEKIVLAPRMGELDLCTAADGRRLQALLQSLKLQAVGTHGPFREDDLNQTGTLARARALEAQKAHLAVVAEVGAKTQVIHPGARHLGVPETELWAALRTSCDSLLPKAEEAQVILCLENLPHGYIGDRIERLLAFVDEYASPWLRTCYDSGHAHMTEGCVTVLDAMGSRVATAHLHDNDGEKDSHLFPGEGTIGWTELARHIRAQSGWCHVEIEAFNRQGLSPARAMEVYRKMLEAPAA